jgi:NitT/TauT family transport system substrate-binding protein
MLPAGKIDFLMTGNMLMAFSQHQAKVPTVVVAAYFSWTPAQITPSQGDKFADLAKAKTVLLARTARSAIARS